MRRQERAQRGSPDKLLYVFSGACAEFRHDPDELNSVAACRDTRLAKSIPDAYKATDV